MAGRLTGKAAIVIGASVVVADINADNAKAVAGQWGT